MRIIKHSFYAVSVALITACGGGGGGGDTTVNKSPTPVVITDGGVQGALDKIIKDASTRQVTLERIRNTGGSDYSSGLYTVTPFIADSYRGNPALSRTITINISNKDGPITLSDKEFYDSNYKPLGAINNYGADFITNISILPNNWTTTLDGDFYSADVFSNNTFSQQIGRSVVNWRRYMSTNIRNELVGSQILVLNKIYYFSTSTISISKEYTMGSNTEIKVNEIKPYRFYINDSSKTYRDIIEFR